VTVNPEIDSKDLVRVFGRLAEKYIMLDGSAGMCCYSACKDCEYREPGGGYRMADQSSARPKWIPSYDERKFVSLGKEHKSKWSEEIFKDGPSVTKEKFIQAVVDLQYSPPLGGPYIPVAGATLEGREHVVVRLFEVLLADSNKQILTKNRMSTQIKKMAHGDEGLTWARFEEAMTH